jgi:rhodanese-related sulfurtransferase
MTRDIDARTLAARLGDDTGARPTVIDVRTPTEFEAGHVPGAVNVPLAELHTSLDELRRVLDDHHDVVLVCRSGTRAGQAHQALGLGRVLSGGLADWERTGGPVNRGRQAWDLERQVRLAAGSLVVTGVLVSAVVPRAKWLAGLVGGGLALAALTDTCALGTALAGMPWNRRGARANGSTLDRVMGKA